MRVEAFVLVGIGLVASAPAQVVLDDFTTGSAHFNVRSGTTYWNQSGSMVGGFRMEGLEILQNPFNTPLDVDVAGGFLSYSQGSGVTSDVALAYGYKASADNTGFTTFDLGLDLSKYSYFDLTVAFDEASMPATIELNNDPSKTYQFTISPRTVTTDYQVGFNLFSGVNFADIHQIAIVFQDPTSNDFTLSSLSAQPAPEPASIAFIGLGVAGLIARRRRK